MNAKPDPAELMHKKLHMYITLAVRVSRILKKRKLRQSILKIADIKGNVLPPGNIGALRRSSFDKKLANRLVDCLMFS
jgi:hypothetical protein